MSAETVRVMVRVRPMNKSETERNCKTCVTVDVASNQIILTKLDEAQNVKNFS